MSLQTSTIRRMILRAYPTVLINDKLGQDGTVIEIACSGCDKVDTYDLREVLTLAGDSEAMAQLNRIVVQHAMCEFEERERLGQMTVRASALPQPVPKQERVARRAIRLGKR